MLMPRKTKYRKQQRGRRRGAAKGQQSVNFGDYGLKSLDAGWVTRQSRKGWRILPIWVGPQAACSRLSRHHQALACERTPSATPATRRA